MHPDEKVCPRCAETIKRAALVCRYCRHEFDEAKQSPAVPVTQTTPDVGSGDPEPSSWLPPVSSVDQRPETDKGVIRNISLGCLGVLVLAGIIGALGQRGASPTATTQEEMLVEPSVDNALDAAIANDASATEIQPTSGWIVDSRKDEIRGKQIHEASLTSTNEVAFDFPYAGGSSLTMTVRKHPEYGEDVIFQISQGQFLCRMDDCSGMISIDGKSETLSLAEPEDNDSKTLFAAYGSGIIKKLKGSKKVIIELPFYQEGNRQFTFETKGLVWPPSDS